MKPPPSQLIDTLLAGGVDAARIEDFLDAVFEGGVEPAALAGVLVALRTRPITAELLTAGARAMRRRCTRVVAPAGTIDTCGTGGDGAGTVNISTGAALLVASMGVSVAKHGNRAASSRCGSADVLEALGFPFPATGAEAEVLLERHRFAFLMAPRFHPAAAHAAPVRKALGIRTLFNLLGPLANPAFVEAQLVGVYDPALTESFARALGELGARRALVVHGGGLDEVALHADTVGHRLDAGHIEPFHWPTANVPLAALAGGSAQQNAAILRETLSGGKASTPVGRAIAVNAGAALWVAGNADSVAEGVGRCRDALDRGIDLAGLGAGAA